MQPKMLQRFLFVSPLATASISSMNTMAGASLRAAANSSRTRIAPMPTYLRTARAAGAACGSRKVQQRQGTLVRARDMINQ